MSELLEKAVARLKSLPRDEQDIMASLILDEIENEHGWDESFTKSAEILARMAQKAMVEYHVGLTEELDLDRLWSQGLHRISEDCLLIYPAMLKLRQRRHTKSLWITQTIQV